MTETRGQADQGEALGALDWADPSDLPTEEVRDVFLTLSKALRAYQLYDPNNPVYKRFVTNLQEALVRVWSVQDRLQILVEEDRLTWMGEEVYRNESRADSLAFMFYRDGIRDVTFEKGIEAGEIEGLLSSLNRTRNARGDGEDLVTMLWDLDLKHFSYSAVEMGEVGDGLDIPPPGEAAAFDPAGILEAELQEASEAEEAEGDDQGSEGQPSPATVSTEDFNPTLYALDDEEQAYIRVELEKEAARDIRVEVLNALFDRLEERDRRDRQREILEILRNLVPNLLSHGALGPAARVAEEVGGLREQSGVLSDDAQALAEELMDNLSAPEAVQELIRALEDGSVAADASELAALLRSLRSEALTSLLKGSEETRDDTVRELLGRSIQDIATANPDLVIRLLADEDPSVACGAIRLAGRMKIAEAGTPLVRLLETGPRQVRKVIVETAAEVPSSVLAGALSRLLKDDDRELRVAAARVLGETKYAPVATELRNIIEDKDFRDADVTEKVAFFEAYGMLAGEEAVSFLDKVLNGKGFLGRKEPGEMRAGAALGLGRAGGTGARASLARASKDDDPVVRSAVGRALRVEEGNGE